MALFLLMFFATSTLEAYDLKYYNASWKCKINIETENGATVKTSNNLVSKYIKNDDTASVHRDIPYRGKNVLSFDAVINGDSIEIEIVNLTSALPDIVKDRHIIDRSNDVFNWDIENSFIKKYEFLYPIETSKGKTKNIVVKCNRELRPNSFLKKTYKDIQEEDIVKITTVPNSLNHVLSLA